MKCKCIKEPMGNHCLEGYIQGNIYRYEYMQRDKNNKPYYRIYHDTDYYETCGVNIFKRYFKIVKEECEHNNILRDVDGKYKCFDCDMDIYDLYVEYKSIVNKLLNNLYKNEVLDTDMKRIVIGEGKDYLNKEDWKESRLSEFK